MATDEEEIKTSVQHQESFQVRRYDHLKLDPHGFALWPQPSDDPLDPLNWSKWLKLAVLLQVSCLAFLGPFTQAIINSAFVPLAHSLRVSVVEASYQTAVPIALAGASSLVWAPISNAYGRRPIFIVVTAVGIAAHAASGAAKTWRGILAARVFVGIGTSAGMSIGAAVVADLFFMHERGRYMGVYVVFVSNGAHLAAVVGGFVAKYSGWRWCYHLGAICMACSWIVNLFALPETLYHRSSTSSREGPPNRASWIHLLSVGRTVGRRKLKFWDFTHVFSMLAYPSVLFPTLCYSLSFGFGSVLFAVTGAAAFGSRYGFDTAGVGLAIGLSTFIGTLIGEIFAGPIISTNIFAYTTDCYKPQSAEISTLLNFGRQTFSFTLGFYSVPFAEKTTWGTAWGVFAIISCLSFLPLILLMYRGQRWREKLGVPDFQRGL